MCVYASGIRMVCKKNTCDLYWFGPRNGLRPVGEVSFILSCTEVLVVGVTSGWERDELPSLKAWVESVCDSAGALARTRRVICSCLSPLERSLHAPFIVSRRCRVTKCWYVVWSLFEKEPRGLGRALSGGDVVCTVEAWRWYFWHCCYMSRHVRHCWGSGFCPLVL
jgi:hypothetical protein